MHAILSLIILIAVAGLVVWGITTLIPMPPQFKTAIYVVTVVALVLYVLSAFGLWSGFDLARPRRLR